MTLNELLVDGLRLDLFVQLLYASLPLCCEPYSPSNVDRWVGRHLFLSHPPRLLSPSVGIECVTTFYVDSDSEWLEDQQQTYSLL
jgi:hypothetical protein